MSEAEKTSAREQVGELIDDEKDAAVRKLAEQHADRVLARVNPNEEDNNPIARAAAAAEQRTAVERYNKAPDLAQRFCRDVADFLKMPLEWSESGMRELTEALALALARNADAIDLDRFVGQINMAFGAAGNVDREMVIGAVRCYRSIVNELCVDDPQKMIDKIRSNKLKADIYDDEQAKKKANG